MRAPRPSPILTTSREAPRERKAVCPLVDARQTRKKAVYVSAESYLAIPAFQPHSIQNNVNTCVRAAIMSLSRRIPRLPLSVNNHLSRPQRLCSRAFSNPPTPSTARVARIQSRLPRFLQSYTTPLLNAPISHIISFLLLHEITAVVPLFGLAGFFHYSQWMPPFVSEGKWVADGMEKFGNWFRRRGWLGEVGEDGKHLGKRGVWWGRSEGGVRIVVE